ncbi:MAG: UDP-2,4-diacetamido-2,4,6-trideoxy-beta-L-altropyranose hydrolase [Gallionellales bacterium 35-53-114]|jgi:UDP-2,4-diacetamido-2,4,6-trideoxy-beta-L-altropyranose hydrolase|nr:MAG: UDP-2,4-diacetamido-2,4,6-trideoxy-beta-L-altropyranose hydrolase [Gallionellales bacterium 35-53-114]OYZ63443.1 MAG: UDP-2,4-diacetamido-2,4,6-trideoxy-beta-L-altropyranose hydrolase [Gallionellales bacterium 24-53-125]OZB10944.1 MAG: UDP-2,4-diacetamido-2,4,6-trideoxy-beta-L-altropyranose hydrolase [Gallionellales bacterium 39-52-133]HQS58872.1 UDP-2,4-diacetamido-2,4,6-trideoxy-beta-L-altropyranose hydrolase [Gallionellaceae bacterium]HQS75743.1 UDP-2,4-diacetamido-2,4,6-trideoxy-bet
MKVAIRTDASSQIGTGHFMRCLALAESLKERGAKTRFVSRHLPEHLRSMLAGKGHEFVSLDRTQNDMPLDELAHAHWLGVSQAQDAADSIRVLSDGAWDWLIVDHYALDTRWESALRRTTKRIMVIDDLADRQHDCDMLLDQNFYADMQARYANKIPSHCELLLGPRYALLRDEFRQLHNQVKPRNGSVKRILVFFGGVDVDNYTGRAIEALSEIGMSGKCVDVVIGAQHPCREQIKAACVMHGYICHIQTDKMAELMAAADLAIGAGGSATWERCCLGLPTLSICLAANQQRQIADAAQEGYLYSPATNKELEVVIKTHTIALLENEYLRRLISRRAMHAVDGRGVVRIIGNMGCSGIAMREVNEDDSEKLFEWRNHSGIRSVSRNAELIKWEDHQKWFSSAMCSTDRILLIGEIGDVPIGVVRFDKHEGSAEVSIYLVPEDNRRGQGRNLLLSAERWIMHKRPDIKYIRASVLGGNIHSQHLFLGSAYRVEAAHFIKQL